MISAPIRRTATSSVANRSCSSRWSASETWVRTTFSNGRSSRSSCETSERSSWSSSAADMTALKSNGSSSVWRSVVGGVSAVIGSTVGAGVSVVVAVAPSVVSGVSWLTSSSIGFSRSSFWTTSWSSRVDSCKSWIACCNSGVMTTRWLCRSESRASMAMVVSRLRLEGEPLAQVDLPGDRVVGDLRRGARDQDLAVVENVRAVGNGEGFAHVMVRYQNADPPFAKPGDDLLDVADRDGIDTREGLVQEQVLRRRDQRPRDLETPALAAGERVGRIARQRGEVELGQELAGALPALGRREIKRLEDGEQVLLDGQLPEYRGFLRQITDALAASLVHGKPGDLFPFEEDSPAVGREQADHHVERRRLARAVGAEQPDDLAALDVEGNGVDNLAALEPLGEALGDQTFHRSVLAGLGGPLRSGLATVLLFGVLGVEDGLDALLLTALHDGAILRDVERDRVAGNDVVLFPDPGVAD